MKCPGCGAAVEDGADLCLECGEPMGDSPAALVARAEPKPVATPSRIASGPAAAPPVFTSLPTRSAFIKKLPVVLIVPPVTWSPTSFSEGTDSPVIIDSSMLEFPSTMAPSTGILSPGRTRS